ncbi:MAG: transposase [Bacteriovoracaceae bacterium]|nr:transposase [Bacteriovoracaceae bacterium]
MKIQTRKNLNIQALNRQLRAHFAKIKDPRKVKSLPLVDIIMSGLAVFQLKIPSLLLLDDMRSEPLAHKNLKRLFDIKQVPSDTQLRDVLDRVPTDEFRNSFNLVFHSLQKDKALEQFKFFDGHKDQYLVSCDATGIFGSTNIKCDYCLAKLQKKQDDDGEKLHYHHQLLAASMVHPKQKTVIPLCPEPIIQQDGQAKNDCEINAAKRLYYHLRAAHPKLPMILLQDGLYSTGANVLELKKHNLSFIIVAKQDRCKNLFFGFDKRKEGLKDTVEFTNTSIIGDKTKKTRTRTYSYVNALPMTGKGDVAVNFIKFKEAIEWIIDSGRKKGQIKKEEVEYAWITDIEISKDNIEKIVEAGRSRWKIENEVFNTLKNQGYQLEHNYGHGKKYLANNFAMLTMLAFLVDQVQEAHCDLFKATLERFKKRCSKIWRSFEFLLVSREFESWLELWSYLSQLGRTSNPKSNTS